MCVCACASLLICLSGARVQVASKLLLKRTASWEGKVTMEPVLRGFDSIDSDAQSASGSAAATSLLQTEISPQTSPSASANPLSQEMSQETWDHSLAECLETDRAAFYSKILRECMRTGSKFIDPRFPASEQVRWLALQASLSKFSFLCLPLHKIPTFSDKYSL
jgi:hypothetical protein